MPNGNGIETFAVVLVNTPLASLRSPRPEET